MTGSYGFKDHPGRPAQGITLNEQACHKDAVSETGSRIESRPAILSRCADHMLCEVFADEGTLVNTSVVFPVCPYQKVTLTDGRGLEIGIAHS